MLGGRRLAEEARVARWEPQPDQNRGRPHHCRGACAGIPGLSVLLIAQLTAFERGSAELTVPLREDLQQHGFVHAGRRQAVCRCEVF